MTLLQTSMLAALFVAGPGVPPSPPAESPRATAPAWSPRWTLRLEPGTGLTGAYGNHAATEKTLVGLIGGASCGLFTAELGGRLISSPSYSLFARLGISPTVVAGKAWSLAIPVLTELRYTRFSGIDYAVFRMTLGLAAGLEVAHRWETTSLGARLLVGRTVASTYHWEYEANWHDLRSDLDTTDVRLDVALHFH